LQYLPKFTQIAIFGLEIYHLATLAQKRNYKVIMGTTGLAQLFQRPNLTEGPAATWDLRRSTKEEEEEGSAFRSICTFSFSECNIG
jgi:hypothetical protein